MEIDEGAGRDGDGAQRGAGTGRGRAGEHGVLHRGSGGAEAQRDCDVSALVGLDVEFRGGAGLRDPGEDGVAFGWGRVG